MSEKEKQALDEISKAVSGMSEAEKARFLGIAEGMSIMKDMSQKNLPNDKEQAALFRQVGRQPNHEQFVSYP